MFLESDSKNTFPPHSSNQNGFLKKIGWYTFYLLYMWAKYELIWSDITAQTVTLGSNLLVMAQTIPQNAQCVIFFGITFGITSKLAPKVTVWTVISDHISSYFAHM